MAVSGPGSSSGSSWTDSRKGMSCDNIKGLVLALSSSFFIGASFIVKKKGLKKAGSSGVRAGYATFYHRLFLTSHFVSTQMNVRFRLVAFMGIVRVFASFVDYCFWIDVRLLYLISTFPWQALAVILTCMSHYGGSA